MASVIRNSYAYGRQPEDAVKFKDYILFDSFLKVLLRYCSDKLAGFRHPDEIKTLANHPAIVPYKDLLMDEYFAIRWKALCEKCPVTDRRYTGSMKDEANNIKLALAKQGSLLKCFGDFPAPPGENSEDLRRFYQELLALQRNGKRKYSVNQRSYISHSLTMVKRKLIIMNSKEQNQQTVEHPSISPKRSLDQAFGTINKDKAETPENGGPPEKRANIELSTIASEQGPKSANTNNPMKAVDFFIFANPQLSDEEAFLQFSYLKSDIRAYFDNFEKNQALLCQELTKRGQNL
uniref:DZIP3-like HEPN domain-containing protein n=2 Tax=Panagrellus redivivus TaxID=6233 RepID=A0A7E4UWP1_PANRE